MRKTGKNRKLQELILHVARRSEEDPYFGATKLNKILFYADFWAYAKLGESITGETYRKLKHGPVPRRLLDALRNMKRAGDCVEREVEYFGLWQRRLLPLREPDLSVFTPEEVAIVDEVILRLFRHSASEVSQLSHRFHGWQVAREGEDIPYETVFVGEPRPLTPGEISYGQRLARERGV